jgi:hypothetical protein
MLQRSDHYLKDLFLLGKLKHGAYSQETTITDLEVFTNRVSVLLCSDNEASESELDGSTDSQSSQLENHDEFHEWGGINEWDGDELEGVSQHEVRLMTQQPQVH